MQRALTAMPPVFFSAMVLASRAVFTGTMMYLWAGAGESMAEDSSKSLKDLFMAPLGKVSLAWIST
jgi:hypothetical protein